MTASRSFSVLLSHSNRPVDFAQCSLDVLTRRYADPQRLDNLPALETLPALDTLRHFPAGLTLLTLTLEAERATLEPVATFDPPRLKVQHAAMVGDLLVVCLEDALLTFDVPDFAALPPVLDIADAVRIDDPWFSGLHTVFATGPERCIVSASAPDAVLEVDLARRGVVRRQRLPAALYGHNYVLTETSDLRDHYIANDLQLTHINCASPDGKGGTVLSTLIQGDIGLLDAAGDYRILSHGHIGCHAARTTLGGDAVYFADTCRGTLVLIDRAGNELFRFAVDSRWLHDVQQVSGDLFLFCRGDRNRLDLVDIASGRIWLSEAFDTRGGAVQFVNIAQYSAPPAS
jgi:hypothetical protein